MTSTAWRRPWRGGRGAAGPRPVGGSLVGRWAAAWSVTGHRAIWPLMVLRMRPHAQRDGQAMQDAVLPPPRGGDRCRCQQPGRAAWRRGGDTAGGAPRSPAAVSLRGDRRGRPDRSHCVSRRACGLGRPETAAVRGDVQHGWLHMPARSAVLCAERRWKPDGVAARTCRRCVSMRARMCACARRNCAGPHALNMCWDACTSARTRARAGHGGADS